MINLFDAFNPKITVPTTKRGGGHASGVILYKSNKKLTKS